MGTTKKPPKPPSKMKNGAATQTLSMKFITSISKPMAMPKNIKRGASANVVRMEATTAPTAVPMAITPTSEEACVVV